MTIEPDTKDWTWVLDQPCPECAFDAAALDRGRLADAIEDNATLWEVVLRSDDVAVRPEPHLWSPLEYACHVRDVNLIFGQRVRMMLEQDDPLFPNWDQDATAVEGDYGSQDPSTVSGEVRAAASEVARLYRSVGADEWARAGRRDNGSTFTIDSLGRYHLHDLVHHAHDVSHVTRTATVGAYDAYASDYRDANAQRRATRDPERQAQAQAALDSYVAMLPLGPRVLEVGSGPGFDAEDLEHLGVSVRRTDISREFVRLLRESGHEADVVDPLHDDLTDTARGGAPYDGAWASASLLHVRRADLPEVLTRIASACAEGAPFHLSVKEGDGARFSTHGAVGAARHFTFWREDGLRAVLEATGWHVASLDHETHGSDPWLVVIARRA